MLRGDADETLPQGDSAFAGDAFAVARGEAVFELLGALVPEEDS